MNNKTVYYTPLPPKLATLLILEKGRDVRIVCLNSDMHIGREAPNANQDIKLKSSIVSRNHGDFLYIDGEYYYKDNNSLNGTFYNGVKLERMNERGSRAVKLSDGDVLRIDRRQLDCPHAEAVEIIYSTTFSPNEKWHRYALTGKSSVPIGRNISEGISLSDFMVSRNHAILKYMGKQWKIVDNGSRNGLAVNKKEIKGESKLHPFDVIRIANTTLIFLGDEIIYNEVSMDAGTLEKFAIPNRSVVMNVNIKEVRVKQHRSFSQKTLLKDINLNIEAGDFVLILGGSGAGKTTFVKTMLGEHKADGSILFDGMDLYKNFKMLKHKIGIVPQFSTTRDNDTVLHTITDAAQCKLAGEYSKQEIQERIDNIISRMMLTSLQDGLIRNLSGGQKKRVEVAIQAIGDQEVFILDEPDSGMDYASRVDLMSNLKSCTEDGSVVLVISHSPDDAALLFSKVIVLAKSKTDEIGHLAFYGDVPNALSFFEVDKLSEIVMEINYEGSGKGRAEELIEKFEKTRGD